MRELPGGWHGVTLLRGEPLPMVCVRCGQDAALTSLLWFRPPISARLESQGLLDLLFAAAGRMRGPQRRPAHAHRGCLEVPFCQAHGLEPGGTRHFQVEPIDLCTVKIFGVSCRFAAAVYDARQQRLRELADLDVQEPPPSGMFRLADLPGDASPEVCPGLLVR